MNWTNVVYHRTRISDSKEIFFYYSENRIWILDKKGPGKTPTDSFVPFHFEELQALVEAILKFQASGENQSLARDFGEFDKRLTVITTDKILNKNGLGVLLDNDDRLWLVGVIQEILRTEASAK